MYNYNIIVVIIVTFASLLFIFWTESAQTILVSDTSFLINLVHLSSDLILSLSDIKATGILRNKKICTLKYYSNLICKIIKSFCASQKLMHACDESEKCM